MKPVQFFSNFHGIINSTLGIVLVFLLVSGCVRGSGSGRQGTRLIEQYQERDEDFSFEEEPEPERPNGAVVIKSDFCSCLKRKADIYNNCDSYCASKPSNNTPFLYVNTTLKSSITLNPEIMNLFNWCNVELEGLPASPFCELEVNDGDSINYLPVIINSGSNSFKVQLNPIEVPEDQRFIARLVEKTTGAASTKFQFRRIRQLSDDSTVEGPLTISPVSMYSCIERMATITNSAAGTTEYYNKAGRIHYYFPSNDTPVPLASGNTLIFCHDIRTNGINDSSLFPRLELIPQVFNLWNLSDLRFYDVNPTDKVLDINGIIQRRLLDQYQISQTINIFGAFKWPNRPIVNDNNSGSDGSADQSSTNVLMGYYMQPWIDSTTQKGFCPTQFHYDYSNTPLFEILKDLVEIDTEGIYLSIREPIVLKNSNGETKRLADDILIIRESLLKQIWFYLENGRLYVPDDSTANTKTIMFYWPPNTVSPLTRNPTQKVYTVKSPENIGSAAQDPKGLRTTVRPPDKRFGCVPVMSSD